MFARMGDFLSRFPRWRGPDFQNMKKCAWDICKNKVGSKRIFCNIKCKRKYFVDKRRKDIKIMAMDYKGGACEVCGYDKCRAALVFHHLEPFRKDFAL